MHSLPRCNFKYKKAGTALCQPFFYVNTRGDLHFVEGIKKERRIHLPADESDAVCVISVRTTELCSSLFSALADMPIVAVQQLFKVDLLFHRVITLLSFELSLLYHTFTEIQVDNR